MSDKNIFIRLKKYKDKQAFMAAYDLYLDQIYRFIYFKVNSVEEAQDLTSQVFVKGWSYVRDGKLNDSNEYRSLKSLLYKIARNAVIDHYRTQKSSDSLDDMDKEIDLIDDRHNLAKQAEIKIDFEILERQLQQLKSEYRGIIVMRYINQLSVAEIADILGKNKNNVRVTIFRALEALKDLVQKNNK